MTSYNTPTDELTISFGPGAVHLSGDEGVGWVSADVALKIEYENHAPEGQTRAVLELVAEQIDPVGWGSSNPIYGNGRTSSDEVHIQIELTAGDLVALIGVASAIHQAAREDDRGG